MSLFGFLLIITYVSQILSFNGRNLSPLCSSYSRQSAEINEGDGADLKTSDIFSLDSIRSTLIRQEETIIFALIERAAFRRNNKIYDNQYGLQDSNTVSRSLLEWMFIETEAVHAKVRRYTSPEEHAFFPQFLPPPILPALEFPDLLVQSKSQVNVNDDIMEGYCKFLDRLCVSGDDEQHGSSVLCDIQAMQAISRRIHMGKFVAESKFAQDRNTYEELLEAGNVQGVLDLLTNVEVERNVLRRSFIKASTYGQDIDGQGGGGVAKLDPQIIPDIYRDLIIPLTKVVEVQYLFRRVGLQPPPKESYWDICQGPSDAFLDWEAPTQITSMKN